MKDYLERCGHKRRIHQREVLLLESQLELQQQRGVIRPCYQPSLEEADKGANYKCQLKDSINRFCRKCVISRQKVSVLRCQRAKQAHDILIGKVNTNNIDILTREVTQLLQTNTQLVAEVAQKHRIITDLFASNNELYLTIKKGTEELQQQYDKRKKLEELIINSQHHVATVSAQLRSKTYSHHDRLVEGSYNPYLPT